MQPDDGITDPRQALLELALILQEVAEVATTEVQFDLVVAHSGEVGGQFA